MANEIQKNIQGIGQAGGESLFARKLDRPMIGAPIAQASGDARVWSLPDLKARKGMGELLERCRQYDQLEVAFDETDGVLWCYMKPAERPSVTPVLARESRDLQIAIKQMSEDLAPGAEQPVRYMVWCSNTPGIFNLGGDLRLFAALVRDQDRDTLTDYAISCIDVVHANATSLDLPIITVSLVEGDALGGGFEAAISSDLVVADHNARFALPEVLFNLFPGMGAYSFISRRVSAVQAERMILSGRAYTGEQLQEIGLVDLVVEPGLGRAAVSDYIAKHTRRHRTQCAVYKAGRRVNPIEYDELYDIAMLWVDTVMELSETDIRKMERLALAQDRRRAIGNMDR